MATVDMRKLFDFSEYKGASRTGEDGWRDEFEILGWVKQCPFCLVDLTQAFCPADPNQFRGSNEGELDALRVDTCTRCGWWELQKSYVLIASGAGRFYSLKSGTLRSYPDSAKDVPISVLRDYIQQHPERIRGIHPSAMEKLVGAVLKEFFSL